MKKNKILFALMLFASIILINNIAKATTISISPSNPKVGDKVTIKITVPNVHTSTVTAKVSGVASGTIKVVGGDMAGNPTTYSNSATYECKQEGTIKVEITEDSSAVLNGQYVNVGASASTKVSAKTNTESASSNKGESNTQTQTKSSVATLANLGIKPNDFSGFSPNKTTYSTTVPNSTTSVEIYAQKGQSGQTITGTGKKQLKEGNNAFSVKVTAEDGKTTKTYNLTVTRKASENTSEENTTNNITAEDSTEETKQENQTGLSQLSIEGITLSPEFKNDIYEYTANISDDKEKLDITATPITENDKVEITGNENLKDGENVITILVSDESGESTVTYQINVKKGANNNEIINKNNEKKREILIISIIGAAIIIIIIAIIVHHIHAKNNIYNGMYMPFEEGVSEQEEMKKEEIYKKRPEKKRKSKGKRFK